MAIINEMNLPDVYEKILKIRIFEEKVLELFEHGILSGTTHAYIGQEANAVGVIGALDSDDVVISNHRCHGHYIAFKDDPYALLCEMMGKKDGLCSGRGGSQHICDGNFFSNGIQGGIVPFSAGIAFAEKVKNNNRVITVFIGDGTLGQGVVYESLNLISKWNLPVLIVVENNRYAQSTKIEANLAGSIYERFNAFGIQTSEESTFDCLQINAVTKKIVSNNRQTSKPQCLILNTYRFSSHSKSDDGRDPAEVERWKKNDPLLIMEGRLSNQLVMNIRNKIINEINYIVDKASKSEPAALKVGRDYY